MTQPNSVAEAIDDIRACIAAAASEAGRNPAEVTLVAVSKTFPAEAIEPAIAAGQRVFGENRVQEAQGKWPELKERHRGLKLHLIGPLQTNKAKEAVALFDVIQTVDRDKIAAALAREMSRQGRTPRLLIQVNTGEEPQKAGIVPQETDDFLKRCREQHGLEIDGLMAIPPFDEAPAPHFALLREIAKRNGLTTISMGMSADYETAVAHGATMVRVGSAIFGARG